jgi:hypothetical protein
MTPSTNSWTIKAPMPTSRDSFAIAVFQNKIYCIGGRVSISEYQPQTFTTVNEVYDPATDTWQTKVPLPTAQWPLQASVVNGNIYVICGSGETYAYNPINDSWTTKAKAPSVYTWPTGFVTAVVDNGIYVIGMSEYNLIYYPLNDSWSQVSSIQPYPSELLLEYGFSDAAAGATTGMSAPEKIYVFFDNQTYVYDTDYNTWTLGAGMPSERVDYGLAVMNDTFFIIGGSNNVYTDMNGRYFPVNANEQYIPIGYGTPDPSYVLEHTPPAITLLSPLNQTYNASGVSLVFTEDKAVNWTDYSLDGKQNVTITGNTTLINIANGLHSITIYANDTYGNIGASQTINFTVAKPQPFPAETVAAILGAAVVVLVIVGSLFYFWKRRRVKMIVRK